MNAGANVHSGVVVAIASKYWQFVGFNAAGQRRVEVLDTAKQFFIPFMDELERQHPQKVDADGFIQRQLWQHAKDHCDRPFETAHRSAPPSARCLRCCVSHLIEQSCYQLSQQFGQAYQFNHCEVLPLVLDANAQMSMRSQSGYESLSSKILQNFDPCQGNLATWTIRLVRNDRRLNDFLLEHGVYLISDWAILNDSRPQQVEKVLLEFHQQTPFEAKAASQLLRCYHAVYRGDRLKSGQKGRCYEPTVDQLHRIATYLQQLGGQNAFDRGIESTILSQLKTLATRLREYRITRRGGPPPLDSIDVIDACTGTVQQIAAPQPDTSDQEQDEFLGQYRHQLNASLDEAIELVLDRYTQRLKKKRQFESIYQSWIKGLYLFHCRNVSMGDLAEKIGLKAQYQVSRLLQLKAMRTDIRQEMLRILQARVLKSAQDFIPGEQVQDLDQKLETVLTEQVDELINQAASEASAARFCHCKSLYTERLCHCLSQRIPL